MHQRGMRAGLLPVALLGGSMVCALAGCAPEPRAPTVAVVVPRTSQAANALPTKLLFGDLHMHTAWSFDAFAFKTTATPDDAYAFAQGAPLRHPSGGVYQLDRPLDFLAVTDHAEFMGVMSAMQDPKNPLHALAVAGEVVSPDTVTATNGFKKVLNAIESKDMAVFDGHAGDVGAAVKDTWARTIEAANRNYKPGKFTSLIGYEWTAVNDGRNLHRNVIFRGDTAPQPFTSLDSNRPEDLWAYLDKVRLRGFAVLAIPHNSNASDGLMFASTDSDGRPIDAVYAATRSRNERDMEITQVKGTSETHPALSPNDEFADFELTQTYISSLKPITHFAGGYAREALMRGLAFQASEGFNPYDFGFVAGTDSHVGMSPVSESHYFGKAGVLNGTPEARLDCTYCQGLTDFRKWSASGLTAVWATENTRAGVYDAINRRETYATTGPRMQARFFAGYTMAGARPGSPDWVGHAYRQGVPMGGVLKRKGSTAPVFEVWAAKDVEGANLDRIQIVKLSAKGGHAAEKIYDVALSNGRRVNPKTGKAPPVGNTVDPKAATYANTIGATVLSAEWRDPDFDPAVYSAYYVRVLEIPTPRWSTFDAKALHRDVPKGIPVSIQERAYTSAIWYQPK